jgi:hypothetical protein
LQAKKLTDNKSDGDQAAGRCTQMWRTVSDRIGRVLMAPLRGFAFDLRLVAIYTAVDGIPVAARWVDGVRPLTISE